MFLQELRRFVHHKMLQQFGMQQKLNCFTNNRTFSLFNIRNKYNGQIYEIM